MRRMCSMGFTLVEMAIVLAIGGILIAMAMPSLRPMVVRNAVASQVNALTATMRFARSEAVARGGPVRMCRVATAGGSNCGGPSTDWRAGWIVVAEDGTLLRRVDAPDATLRIVSVEGLEALAWGASGDLVARPGGGALRFEIASPYEAEGEHTRLVCVSQGGRPRLSTPGAGCAGG